MKKIILSAMALIGIITLGSCKSNSQESDTLDDSARTSAIATAWLEDTFKVTLNSDGTEASSTFEIINGADSTSNDESKTAHYELYLPKSENINDSVRMNAVSLSNVSNKSKLYLNYASTTNFAVSDYQAFINVLSTDENKAKISAISEVSGLEALDTPSKELELTNEYLANDSNNRTLATVYVPMLVKYFKFTSDGTKKMTLYTFVLIPTYYSLTLRTNTTSGDSTVYTYTDSKVESIKDKSISFTISNGKIQ